MSLPGVVRDPVAQLNFEAKVQAGKISGSGQSIPHNTTTVVTFTTVALDTGKFFTGTALTIRKAGAYLVGVHANFAANTSGARYVAVRQNTAEIAPVSGLPGSFNTRLSASTIVYLKPTDAVDVVVYQDSGVSLTLDVANFWIIRL